MNREEILSHVDHTLLKPEATWPQIQQLCDEAIANHTASVCINTCYVKQAVEYMAGRIPVCCVVGFPLGAMDNARKALDSGGNIYVWQERYSRAVERLAREENVPLVDVRGAFLDYGHLEQTLCADGTHPNTVGQGLITKAFQDFGRGLRLAGQTV